MANNGFDKERELDTAASRDRSLDDFWDIDRLLPEKRRPSVPAPRPTPRAVDLELPTVTREAKTAEAASATVKEEKLTVTDPTAVVGVTHFVPPHNAEEAAETPTPCEEYVPDGVLLHRVKVYEWPSGYHYFDQFLHDAKRFDKIKGEPSPRQPFFSYFPQYVQMNRRQTAWYLWWREQVRAGRYLDTDYAYILLYLFELINLPAAPMSEEARRHRDLMACVWVAYRRTYPQLDHYMCEWMCDYCLIHRLVAPVDHLAPALNDIIAGSRLKEFYLTATMSCGGEEDALATARILLRHCCQYDYRKSKFAQGEHKGLFDRVIPAAIAAVFPLLTGQNGGTPLVDMQDSTISRDAYTGALCAYGNKRRIEVSFTSFSRSHELRFLIGDMVKHTENRLRGRIGVRSRLSVMSLPVPLRNALDEYLTPLLPEGSAHRYHQQDGPPPAYEKLYDTPRKQVSLADADAIEQASWATTRILTEAFAEEKREAPVAPDESDIPIPPVADTPVITPAPTPDPIPAPTLAPISEPMPTHEPVVAAPHESASASPLAVALGEDRATFLRYALEGNTRGQREMAARLRKMADALADEINAITAETEIYDVVLEDDGRGGYTVAEDYRDMLIELLGGNL